MVVSGHGIHQCCFFSCHLGFMGSKFTGSLFHTSLDMCLYASACSLLAVARLQHEYGFENTPIITNTLAITIKSLITML